MIFEGATADAYETSIAVTDPTADRTITLPNASGTVSLLDNTETLTNKTLTSAVLNTPTTGNTTFSDGAYNFNIASHDGSNGLQLGGTLVTASAAELNYLDITTLGTSQASKAVTVNADGDLIIPDGDKFKFGTGSDMQVYHDGSQDI